eukprot:7005521-Pyramimonas_sp.AAC.1
MRSKAERHSSPPQSSPQKSLPPALASARPCECALTSASKDISSYPRSSWWSCDGAVALVASELLASRATSSLTPSGVTPFDELTLPRWDILRVETCVTRPGIFPRKYRTSGCSVEGEYIAHYRGSTGNLNFNSS